MTDLSTPYRTHTCGELRASDAGGTARLSGWVHRRRDHGHLIFLDLRDRHGLTQVVVDEAEAPIDETLRLRYRYLDIRREPMQQRLLLRSRLVQAIREVHHESGFVEVETPSLIKSTPEGARDFIVPSRLQPGMVYALPQSPQQLKQLLMVAGLDRYFQIARCFRDEDLRGDRQPEFTQLDLEMSFVDEATVMAFVESVAIEVSKAVVPERPLQTTPFPVFTYEEALAQFG